MKLKLKLKWIKWIFLVIKFRCQYHFFWLTEFQKFQSNKFLRFYFPIIFIFNTFLYYLIILKFEKLKFYLDIIRWNDLMWHWDLSLVFLSNIIVSFGVTSNDKSSKLIFSVFHSCLRQIKEFISMEYILHLIALSVFSSAIIHNTPFLSTCFTFLL